MRYFTLGWWETHIWLSGLGREVRRSVPVSVGPSTLRLQEGSLLPNDRRQIKLKLGL